MELNSDGSMAGKTFSGMNGYVGEHPRPISGETYAQYRERVQVCVSKGFHLGDLSQTNWRYYCMGSGHYEGVSSNDRI